MRYHYATYRVSLLCQRNKVYRTWGTEQKRRIEIYCSGRLVTLALYRSADTHGIWDICFSFRALCIHRRERWNVAEEGRNSAKTSTRPRRDEVCRRIHARGGVFNSWKRGGRKDKEKSKHGRGFAKSRASRNKALAINFHRFPYATRAHFSFLRRTIHHTRKKRIVYGRSILVILTSLLQRQKREDFFSKNASRRGRETRTTRDTSR